MSLILKMKDRMGKSPGMKEEKKYKKRRDRYRWMSEKVKAGEGMAEKRSRKLTKSSPKNCIDNFKSEEGKIDSGSSTPQ
jgi:hypothetical protein